MTVTDDSSAPVPLAIRGVLLRSVLLLALDATGRSMSLPELGAAVARGGFAVPGRTSKVLSDALRCEIARGRVRRHARGLYRIGRLPRTTRWRCRQRVEAAQWGAAPSSHLHPRGRRGKGRSTDGEQVDQSVAAVPMGRDGRATGRDAPHRRWGRFWSRARRSVDAPLPPDVVAGRRNAGDLCLRAGRERHRAGRLRPVGAPGESGAALAYDAAGTGPVSPSRDPYRAPPRRSGTDADRPPR